MLHITYTPAILYDSRATLHNLPVYNETWWTVGMPSSVSLWIWKNWFLFSSRLSFSDIDISVAPFNTLHTNEMDKKKLNHQTNRCQDIDRSGMMMVMHRWFYQKKNVAQTKEVHQCRMCCFRCIWAKMRTTRIWKQWAMKCLEVAVFVFVVCVVDLIGNLFHSNAHNSFVSSTKAY